ncbi:NAD(P)-binding protein [Durotheca rogersii]|uniref:NAD(P)-binding protein n=1 Tax=Durotheca rogersii TaxID=419775 RepID=UPI00221E5902|nr:NAD(P)-binding protein [Durotheca rogersii]KAI5860928.1 NAD(P)-binding protein [Durotheca rogersii]
MSSGLLSSSGSVCLPTGAAILGVTAVAALFLAQRVVWAGSPRRLRTIPPAEERVLILGASSGLGRTIAKRYAARGARVCVVARRADRLSQLADECGAHCIWESADFADVGAMVRLRDKLLAEWGGLDSLYVCAGVSAVQPVMALAGVGSGDDGDATSSGIQNAVDTAARATRGNVYGPLIAALAFIPALTRTSAAPSILLVSSLAAVVPAPTRALYAATKASSLLLYQSLAIEHPDIVFASVLPATMEGDFRASAVDADTATRAAGPNRRGLKLDYVVERCVEAMDRETRGSLVVPWFPYAVAHHLYYLWPSVIERQARKKYDFGA